MKKAIFSILLCSTLLLSGCAGEAAEATNENGTVTIADADIVIAFPESYDIKIGDEIYEMLVGSASAYKSADELKKQLKANGTRHIAQGSDGELIAIVSAQDMTPDEDTERTTLADYARQVHDTTIFEYYASGYRTTENTSLTEETYGGKDGWVSVFEVITKDDPPQFVIGYAEFMFEQGDDIYSVQVGFNSAEDKEKAIALFDLIKDMG